MKNTELFDLIKSFSDEEIKSFDKFLLSPYFVSGSSLSKVFREIIKNKNLFLDTDYKRLNAKLLKRLKYSKLTFNKLLSYLSKEVLKYLKLKSFESDNISSELIFNEYLLKKKKYTSLENNLKKTASLINSETGISDKTFLHSFQNNSIKIDSTFFNLVKNYEKDRAKKLTILKNAILDTLLYSYMEINFIYLDFNILHFGFDDANEKALLSEIELFFARFNETGIFEANSKHKIIFYIYRKLYQAYHQKDKKYYFVYKKSFKDNIGLFNIRLIYLHYQAMISFCMLMDRLGHEKEFYKKECLNLLIEYFKNNYFKIDGVDYVSRTEFSNFIGRAYTAKEYELLKSFIENISSKLRPSDYKDMVNLGYAFYHLGIKEYRKSLKNINSIVECNAFIKFDLRNIELRIYYELGRMETLLDSIHNYRTIILNNKTLNKKGKENLLTLLKYLNILISIKNKTNPHEQTFEAGYYKKQIEKESFFSLKNWLLEKFEDIEKDITTQKRIKNKAVN